MTEYSDLYQEMVLEHSKSPRNFRVIQDADQKIEGFNPLCGDRFTVYVKLKGDVVEDIGFQGAGCAISKASASLMTTAVKGKSKQNADMLFNTFNQMLKGNLENSARDRDLLGKLIVFQGVTEFPTRIKCANLAWHTMRAALKGKAEKISTESLEV